MTGQLSKPKLLFMTRREWWNYFLWQWFFVRRCSEVTIHIDHFEVSTTSQKQGGEPIKTVRAIEKKRRVRRDGWLFGAIPLSGWDSRPFEYVGGSPTYAWGSWRTLGVPTMENPPPTPVKKNSGKSSV